MTVIEQASYDILKERNDQLFRVAKELLEALRSTDDRDHFSEVIEHTARILEGDMTMSPFEKSIKEAAEKNVQQLIEDLRLAKIWSEKLERRFAEVVEAKFLPEDQREHWEAAWNYLYNEFGRDMTGVTVVLGEHFYLVPKTPRTS